MRERKSVGKEVTFERDIRDRGEMQPILRLLHSGLFDEKRAVRLLGVSASRLISADEMRRARQVVTPTLWQEAPL